MEAVRISEIAEGGEFVTPLTHRRGVVVRKDFLGVTVRFDDGDQPVKVVSRQVKVVPITQETAG